MRLNKFKDIPSLYRTHSTCYPINTRKVIESSLDFAALRILGTGYCLRISKTYRWMLDGKDSRTHIKSDLKGWRHRSICFFGAFDRLFDVSATHYDVFSYTYDVFSYTFWCVSLHITMCLATHHDVFLPEKRMILVSEATHIRRSFMGYQVTWRKDPI